MYKSLTRKIFMVTRFFALIITVQAAFMTVMLASNTSAQNQSSVHNIEVTMSGKDHSIAAIFASIESQTGLKFSIDEKSLEGIMDKLVFLDKKKSNLSEILLDISKEAKISFKRVNNYISVKKLEDQSWLSEEIVVQDVSISGKVTDENGEGLPGASVVVKGTTNGTTSDLNGDYSLEVPEGSTLTVSFVGYKTLELQVGNENVLDIQLEVDAEQLEEVVVIGYGTIKKSDLTGSIVQADIEAFREAPNTSIMQSLQGSVPGVQIGQVNRAGQDPSISIRGETTIEGNKSPLIVLDGAIYRGRISDINPADIKSVDILKDAASKAVYGAQAANGVIMITTKGGGYKKPTITYTGAFTTSSPTKNYRLLDREEWLDKIRTIEYKDAYTEESGFTQANPSWDFSQSQLLPVPLAAIDTNTDFDWWEAATRNGAMQNHTVNIAGGTENVSYFVSAGYTNQSVLIINDDYTRTNLRANLDMNITDWLTIGTNTFLTFADFSGTVPSIGNIRRMAPVVSPYDADGNLVSNPLGDNSINPLLNAQARDSDKRHQLNLNNYAKIDIPWVQGLSYRLNYNYTLNARNQANFNEYGAGLTGSSRKEVANSYYTLLDNIVNYSRSFGNHDISATFVYGFNEVKWDGTVAQGEGYSNPALGYNSLEQATNQFISSGAWEEVNLYQMGRVIYDFQNRYLVTATLRRDGFSGFAANNKFGLFPSIGLGWVMSDEEFIGDVLEYLKVRASYGVTGNQTSRYSSLAKVSAGDGQKYVFGDGAQTVNGQSLSSMANSDLTWETTYETNIGVDFTFFDEKLRGSIDYYNSTTKDLLWDVVIPNVTGFSSVRTNLGELKNSGIEINLNGSPIQTEDFSWNVNLNLAHNRNEVASLLGLDNDGDGQEDDLVASGLFIGESLGTIYGYEVDGIWQIGDDVIDGFFPGSYRIVDQAGPNETAPDGVITAADDRVILGTSRPLYTMGIMNSLNYKNFNFRFLFNIIQGGSSDYMGYNSRPSGTPGTFASQNWFNSYDMWSPLNPGGSYAIGWDNPAINTQLLQSRSFVRLQDISLSYTLDSDLTDKIGLGSAKIYVSGKNLFTLTGWDGWDPETGQGINSTAYPVMRSYTLGLNVSF